MPAEEVHLVPPTTNVLRHAFEYLIVGFVVSAPVGDALAKLEPLLVAVELHFFF